MRFAVEIERVTLRRDGGFQIPDLTLRVPMGAIYGFLGPNGAGKTTTIRLLLGLERADTGRITVLGQPVPARVDRALAGIGYVPERPHLHRFLTVAESIALHRAFYPTWDSRWAAELTRQFGLTGNRQLARLSKGEMGKLMILQALAQRPALLVLDEPTDGLDPVVRREVLSAVIDYVAAEGATVLISSHLVHELERLCDWVGVMDSGRLVVEVPMSSLKDGIKRLRIRGELRRLVGSPFTVLEATGTEGAGLWVVDGWEPPMRDWIEARGVTIDEVIDLDLEDGFVERLKARRVGGSAHV